MLTAIEIQNFKAFGDTQRIELRPLTLLFGPNSGGKSSIIHALHYARELLLGRSCDVHRTESGADLVDLGGINRLVHGRQLDGRPITIRLEMDLANLWRHAFDSEDDWEVRAHQDWSPVERLSTGAVTLHIPATHGASVERLTIELNQILFAEIAVAPRKPGQSVSINWGHPALLPAELMKLLVDQIGPLFWNLNSELKEFVMERMADLLKPHGGLGNPSYPPLDFLSDHLMGLETIIKLQIANDPTEDEDLRSVLQSTFQSRPTTPQGPAGEVQSECFFIELANVWLQSLDELSKDLRAAKDFPEELATSVESACEMLESHLQHTHDAMTFTTLEQQAEQWGDRKHNAFGNYWGVLRSNPELRASHSTESCLPNWGPYHIELEHSSDSRGDVNARKSAIPSLTSTTPAEFFPVRNPGDGDARCLNDLLSTLIIGPAKVAIESLEGLRYLGPLRTIPGRHEEPPPPVGSSRWPSGIGAWDRLATADNKLIDRINEWLEEEELLDTGYRLHRSIRRWLDDDVIRRLAEEGPTDENEDAVDLPESAWNAVSESLQETKVSLFDTHRGIEVAPCDVGVGLSQVIPAIVAALDTESKLVAMEQPELHLHPRQQAALGDLLIEGALTAGNEKRNLIIETHSEHLILRLLRRIRETTEKRAPEGFELKPTDVRVLHVSPGDGSQAKVNVMRINTKGDLIDPWPDDFFDQDYKERFA